MLNGIDQHRAEVIDSPTGTTDFLESKKSGNENSTDTGDGNKGMHQWRWRYPVTMVSGTLEFLKVSTKVSDYGTKVINLTAKAPNVVICRKLLTWWGFSAFIRSVPFLNVLMELKSPAMPLTALAMKNADTFTKEASSTQATDDTRAEVNSPETRSGIQYIFQGYIFLHLGSSSFRFWAWGLPPLDKDRDQEEITLNHFKCVLKSPSKQN